MKFLILLFFFFSYCSIEERIFNNPTDPNSNDFENGAAVLFCDSIGSIGTTFKIFGYNSWSNNSIKEFKYDLNNDGIYELSNTFADTIYKKFKTPGKKQIRFAYIGKANDSSFATKTITVLLDRPKIQNNLDTIINIRDSLKFECLATDSFGFIAKYYWKILPNIDTITNSPNIDFYFADSGKFNIIYYALDTDSIFSLPETSSVLVLLDKPKVVTRDSIIHGLVNVPCSLFFYGFDSLGNIIDSKILCDADFKTSYTDSILIFSFSKSGTYNCALTVMDDDSLWSKTKKIQFIIHKYAPFIQAKKDTILNSNESIFVSCFAKDTLGSINTIDWCYINPKSEWQTYTDSFNISMENTSKILNFRATDNSNLDSYDTIIIACRPPSVKVQIPMTNINGYASFAWSLCTHSEFLYYDIWRKTNNGTATRIKRISNINQTNYVDSLVEFSNTYYYYIKVIGKYADSYNSNIVEWHSPNLPPKIHITYPSFGTLANSLVTINGIINNYINGEVLVKVDEIFYSATIIDSSFFSEVILKPGGNTIYSWVISEFGNDTDSVYVIFDRPGNLSDITVNKDTIDFFAADLGKVDGDIISLYLDDSLIISNVNLIGTEKKVPLVLYKRYSKFIIYAVDAGIVPPNTAQIRFTDVIEGDSLQSYTIQENKTAELIIKCTKFQ